MIHVDAVDLVICIGSSTCNAIGSLAEKEHVPLVGWASNSDTSRNRKFVVRSYPSGELEGKRAVDEAMKRGFSKVGVVTAIHDYSVSWQKGVSFALPHNLLTFDEQLPPDLKDFKSLLVKARLKGVEEFLICLLPGQVGLFAKQAYEMGIKPKIGGCEFLQDENEAEIANGALAGAWYIEVEISPEFRSRYMHRYGNENILAGAAIHFDLFNLLQKVAKKKKSEIIPSLMGIGQFRGAAGSLTMLNDKGDQFFDYILVAKEVPAL